MLLYTVASRLKVWFTSGCRGSGSFLVVSGRYNVVELVTEHVFTSRRTALSVRAVEGQRSNLLASNYHEVIVAR